LPIELGQLYSTPNILGHIHSYLLVKRHAGETVQASGQIMFGVPGDIELIKRRGIGVSHGIAKLSAAMPT
jgi:hypothetical protein